MPYYYLLFSASISKIRYVSSTVQRDGQVKPSSTTADVNLNIDNKCVASNSTGARVGVCIYTTDDSMASLERSHA